MPQCRGLVRTLCSLPVRLGGLPSEIVPHRGGPLFHVVFVFAFVVPTLVLFFLFKGLYHEDFAVLGQFCA